MVHQTKLLERNNLLFLYFLLHLCGSQRERENKFFNSIYPKDLDLDVVHQSLRSSKNSDKTENKVLSTSKGPLRCIVQSI